MLGMDDASLSEMRASMALPAIVDQDGVWPENVAIVEAFLAVASQWRLVAIGGGFAPSSLVYLGLDYVAVRTGLDAEAIAVTPELWRGLRVMEAAACAALNEVKSPR